MFDTLKPTFFHPTAMTIYWVILSIVIVVVLVRFADRAASRSMSNKNHRYLAKKLINIIGYIAAIIIIIVWFSSKLTGFAVAFGVAGAGIAFALQEVIASFAWWMGIMFGDFYKAGDRIQLWGIKWDVIDIGILRTTIMEIGERVWADQYNGRIVRVANSFVFKEPVYNYSWDFPFLRDEFDIPIYYDSDCDLMKQVILQAAHEVTDQSFKSTQRNRNHLVRQYLVEDATLEPAVTMNITDKGIIFTLRYIVAYDKRRSVKDELSGKILTAINNSGGKLKIAAGFLKAIE